MKSVKEIQTYQSKLKRKPSLEEYGVIEEDSSSDDNQVSVSKLILTKSQNMLTADRRISTADRYLLEDLVGFGGMDCPCWIFMGAVGISYG